MEAVSARLAALRRLQSPDGAWGYGQNRQSWLEPTFYAALAFLGQDNEVALRAWNRIRTWQNADGGFRPNPEVAPATWVTAFGVTLGVLLKDLADTASSVESGIRWLVRTSGTETAWINRAAARTGLLKVDRNLHDSAWPWTPGSTSWVEPTAHAVVALQMALAKGVVPAHQRTSAEDRIRQGQAALLQLRCRDGGWNYGNRSVMKVDLPSYPQTTGVALHGLQQVPAPRLDPSLERARQLLSESKPGMAHAWLSISLRNLGVAVASESRPVEAPATAQPLELALELLAEPGGNAGLLRVRDQGAGLKISSQGSEVTR